MKAPLLGLRWCSTYIVKIFLEWRFVEFFCIQLILPCLPLCTLKLREGWQKQSGIFHYGGPWIGFQVHKSRLKAEMEAETCGSHVFSLPPMLCRYWTKLSHHFLTSHDHLSLPMKGCHNKQYAFLLDMWRNNLCSPSSMLSIWHCTESQVFDFIFHNVSFYAVV